MSTGASPDYSSSINLTGIAFWFDVVFDGSNTKVTLTTAPGAPATHWQQMRCMFQQPLQVQDGDCLVGKVTLRATRQQSYTAHGDVRCLALPPSPPSLLLFV